MDSRTAKSTRPSKSARTLVATIGIRAILASSFALPPLITAAEQPAFQLTAASVDRIQLRLDELLALYDRPELADILANRLEKFRNLPGLDRTRSLHMWRFPPTSEGENDTLVIPITDAEAFLSTLTADIVAFEKTSADLYVIDRPDIPYYGRVAGKSLLLGDSLPHLRSLTNSADLATRTTPRSPDISISWNWRAWPAQQRQATADIWRQTLEPWMQRRDLEPEAEFRQRIPWVAAAVTIGEVFWKHTDRIELALRILAEQREAVIDIDLYLSADHPLAETFGNWRPLPHPLRSWTSSTEARASGFVQSPTGWPGLAGTGLPRNVAWQVFADHPALRTMVLVIDQRKGAEFEPRLDRDVTPAPQATERLPQLPDWTRDWIGGNPWVQRFADDSIAGWGFGPTELARERLVYAQLQLGEALPVPPSDQVVADIRLPLRDLWDDLGWIDPLWANEQLRDTEDRVRISLVAHRQRLQFRVVIPEGGLRVLAAWFAEDLSVDLEQYLGHQ